MSNFRVEVIALPKAGRHKNADTLQITQIFDYPVIFSDKEGLKQGDLVAYIPVDAVLPMDNPLFKFLDSGKGRTHERLRAKKLRGIFSMGILVRAPEGSQPGQNVAELLGITKYEEPEELSTGGDAEKDPCFAPQYTSIENARRYKHLLQEGEPVVCTEKIHGACSMYCYRDGRLWARSHRQYKRQNPSSIWWKAAANEGLEEKLKLLGDNYCVYGEVFGNVQDLLYGAKQGEVFFRAFDVFNISTGAYVDYEDAKKMVTDVGIKWVPELFKGPIDIEHVKTLIEGQSTLAANICEGTVIKPLQERFNAEVGRVILKLISQNYLLRKGGSEHH